MTTRSDEWVENRPPKRGIPALRLSELWTSRELTYFFALRDLKVRYKQSLLGSAWIFLNPVIGALAFTFMFNGLADIETDGSYFVFALTGFLVWSAVSGAIGAGAGSLLEHDDLITHVSFPMIAAPASVFILTLFDLAIGSTLPLVWSLVDGDGVSATGLLVGVPLGFVMVVLVAAGPAFFFAASTVRYRDTGAFLGLGVQALFFLGPVGYPEELIDERWREVQYLNPVTGCLALYRWGFGGATPEPNLVLISAGVALVAAIGGLLYFRYNEPTLTDVI